MSWLYGVSRRPESRLAQYADGGHAAMIFKTHPELVDTLTTWFDAVLRHTPERLPATNGVPLASAVLETLHQIDQPGGAAAALERRVRTLPDSRSDARVPEPFVNQLGYEHMLAKDYAVAIDLMKLNAATYPDSPNAMDSLGDVYVAAGDQTAALSAAKRTLVLLDTDTADTPQRKAVIRKAAEEKIARLSAR